MCLPFVAVTPTTACIGIQTSRCVLTQLAFSVYDVVNERSKTVRSSNSQDDSRGPRAKYILCGSKLCVLVLWITFVQKST